MKKFILGLTCGIGLTATTAVYASDTIQAYLFSASFVIKGEPKNLHPDYTALNHNGHVYVPIRFISESLGAKVAYEENTKTITVDEDYYIVDINNREVSAGHVVVTKEGDHSVITGKLHISHVAWNHKSRMPLWEKSNL